MARARTQPPAAPATTATVERPQYAEPTIPLPDPPPQYAAPSVLDEPDLSEIQEIARNASYMLLCDRSQEWQLLAHGIMGGAVVRTFGSMDEGVKFVKAAGITNCRLASGVIQ